MRNFKKVLSLVLCMAMMMSVMVVGAGAAFKDQEKIKNAEAVDACSALNIINGYTDNTFKPEGNITRAEACKMICVALNGGKDPVLGTNAKATFTDTKGHWAEKYIESCVSQGIVAGIGGGKFDPNGNVTGSQFAKMLLIALGYNADNQGYVGAPWEVNVNVDASAKGLYADLAGMDPSKALSRDNAAQMLWNALNAYEVEYKYNLVSENGQLVSKLVLQDKVVGSNNDKITLLRDKYDAWMNVGTLVNVDGKDLTISMNAADRAASDLYKANLDKDVDEEMNFTKLGTDYSALLGQKVKVIFKNGKTNDVIGVYATSDNTVYNTIVNAIEKDGTKIKFDGKSYSVESGGIKVYVDGVSKGMTALANFNDAAGTKIYTEQASDNCQSPNFIKFVDSNDNGKIDTAIVTTVTLAKVTYVSSKEIIAGNVSYKYEDHNVAKDIAKDDYVVVTKNLFDDCQDVVKAQKLTNVSLSGTKNNPDKYQLDGAWYVAAQDADMNSVVAGNKVDAWVYNGVVAYAKRTSGEAGNVGDICVIKAMGSNIEGDKVKIVDFNGKESIVVYDTDLSKKDTNNDGVNDDGYVLPDGNAMKIGAAYEYEVVKGEYRFKQLNTTSDWYGDYTAQSTGSAATAANVGGLNISADGSSKVEKINRTKINDNAKVILVDKVSANKGDTADTKVITGKQLKSLTVGTDVDNVYVAGGIAAFTSKVDGLTQVTYAVVGVNKVASSFSTNDNYAYITDTAYVSSAGYITYKVWTGEKEEPVIEKKSNTDGRSKGTVIGYSSIKDGEIEDVTTTIVTTEGAIQGVNEKQTKVTFDGSTQYDITADTVILYVDTENHEGLRSGSIVEANKFGDAYMNNVIYKTDGTDEVELLVIDVKNKLYGEVTLNSATADDINAALVSGDVTVKTLPTTGTVKVPAGKTLTVVDAQTAAQLEGVVGLAAGAKLVVKAASTTNASANLFGSMSGTTFTAITSAPIGAGTYEWTNVAASGAAASYKWVK